MSNIETFNFKSMVNTFNGLGLTITEKDDDMKTIVVTGDMSGHEAHIMIDENMMKVVREVGGMTTAHNTTITDDLNLAIRKAVAYVSN